MVQPLAIPTNRRKTPSHENISEFELDIRLLSRVYFPGSDVRTTKTGLCFTAGYRVRHPQLVGFSSAADVLPLSL